MKLLIVLILFSGCSSTTEKTNQLMGAYYSGFKAGHDYVLDSLKYNSQKIKN